MSVQRWANYGNMHEEPTGHWVNFFDHQSSLAEREQRIKVLEQALQALLQACGHENCGSECGLSAVSKQARAAPAATEGEGT